MSYIGLPVQRNYFVFHVFHKSVISFLSLYVVYKELKYCRYERADLHEHLV